MSTQPSPGILQRLSKRGAAQQEGANQALAGQEALAAYETASPAAGYGADQGPAGQSQAAQRLSSGQWAGKTGVLNNAQAAQATSEPAWVTVPVDKVVVEPDGRGHVAPVYASTKGYRGMPGQTGGSVPPMVAAGR